MSWLQLPRLWELITPGSDLGSERRLKQTCSSPRELSNGVSHSVWKHRDRVDCRLLVVGSQTAILTPGPSFDHNLCCKCPNGSCEAIFDIYISRPFQRHKEHLKARCFSFYYLALKLWESRRTPSSHFRECESHPHTCLKVGLQHSLSQSLPLFLYHHPPLLMLLMLIVWSWSWSSISKPKIKTIARTTKKKHKKKEWELNWNFQEMRIAKLPWVKIVVGCDGKLSMVCCKICSEIDGREKLMVPKFDNLEKHVGWQKCKAAHLGCAMGQYFMSVDT